MNLSTPDVRTYDLTPEETAQPWLEMGKPPVAARYNQGKPDLSYLLDWPKALRALVRVSEQGAIKYERNNWKKGGKPDTEYLASALRHMLDFHDGAYYDSDIGTAHIANAVWNLLSLIELNHRKAPDLDPEFDQEAFEAKYADKSAFN